MSSSHSSSAERRHSAGPKSSSRGSTPGSDANNDGGYHHDDNHSRAGGNEQDNVSFSSMGQLNDLVDDAKEDRERKRQHARVVEEVCSGVSGHGNPAGRRSSSSNILDRSKEYQRNGRDDVDFMTMNSGSPEADGYVRDLGQRLATLADVLAEEESIIRETHLKDYVRLPNLKRLLVDVEMACKEYHQVIGQLSAYVERVQTILSNLGHVVDKKLSNEGLYSWLDGGKTSRADSAGQEDEKALLHRASQARLILSRTKTDVIKSEERVASLEVEAAESAEAARLASQEAEALRIATAEAKRAAEQRKRAEEEARRKAEEEKKKKAEEARKKKEEEERIKAEKSKMAGTPEEQERKRQEEEKKNPKNWPMFVYSVDPGDLEIPVGCVVRVLPKTLRREDVDVERLEQLDDVIHLEDNEELVSHIIDPVMSNEARSIKLEEPMAIAIPHCAPRNHTREAVIKRKLRDGTWKEIPTHEVVFEDIKDYKFVEARMSTLGPLAVVTRYKREEFNVYKKSSKITLSVDSRVSVNFKASTFRQHAAFSCEMQPVELSAVSDLKQRRGEQCDALLAASPIITLVPRNATKAECQKPSTILIPVPPPPIKAKRPGTASSGRETRPRHGRGRPVSAMLGGPKEEDEKDVLHLFRKTESLGGGEKWVLQGEEEGINLVQSKNKDLASFEVPSCWGRYLILRTKESATDSTVTTIAEQLEKSLKQRVVQFLLRQRSDDAHEVCLQCVPIHRTERYLKKLAEEGYDVGPQPSKDIILHEGQKLHIGFRGNVSDGEDEPLQMVYNTHIRTRLEFCISEVDKYAQKGIECYRGFVQVFTRGMVETMVPVDQDKSGKTAKNQQMKSVWEEGDLLLYELLINLPKPQPEPPKPIPRAPLTLKSEGLIDDALLHLLASELGDEWRRLAHYLSVRRVRLQAILRNNINKDQTHIVYDMLLTWAKKVPHSVNKVDVLCRALGKAGRLDLVEGIRDRERDYKRERAQLARVSYLRKAFVRLAQNTQVVTDWKVMGRELGLSELEVNDIEVNESGGRDKCMACLERWSNRQGEDACVDLLAKHLRKCKFTAAAEEVLAVT